MNTGKSRRRIRREPDPDRKQSSPIALRKAIGSVIAGLGIEGKLEEYDVVERWPKIVGPKIAAETKAERIKDGKLWIKVSHGAWRNELTFMKDRIVKKVNAEFGRVIIKDIVLR